MSTEEIKRRLITELPYYAEHQLRIKPKVGALMPFTLNRAQLYLHERIEEQRKRTGKVRIVILKGRQQGCSTYVGARFFHKTATKPGILTFIFAHDSEASSSLYGMVKTFYEDCADPAFMPVRTASNAKELLFNGLKSGYKVGTAGTTGMGRSKTFQQIHWSEVAYSPNCDDHAAGILQTVADAPGTEIILESTANGQGNYFHRACNSALTSDGDYELVFIPWYWQPEYTRALPPEGFDLEPPKENQDFMSEQEYYDLFKHDGLTLQHMNWRRQKIRADFQGEVPRFMCEYPFTPEEAFEATAADSYIKAMLIRKARNARPIDSNQPLIWGVDPARLGGDKFKICHRKGRAVTKLVTYPAMRLDQSTQRMIQDINKYKPYRVNIDCGGLGVGLYDNLIGAGFGDLVRKVDHGGSSSDEEKWHDQTAEMFNKARLWLEDEPCSIQLPEREGAAIQAQLSARKHEWKRNSILKMESKEKVKETLGVSPDDADSFLLTFATDVANPQQFKGALKGQVIQMNVEGWSPFS